MLLGDELHSIPNVWTLLGLVAVLAHQMVGRWYDRRQTRLSAHRWKALNAALTEIRARAVQQEARLERLETAVQLLARGTARPPESPAP